MNDHDEIWGGISKFDIHLGTSNLSLPSLNASIARQNCDSNHVIQVQLHTGLVYVCEAKDLNFNTALLRCLDHLEFRQAEQYGSNLYQRRHKCCFAWNNLTEL